MSLTVHQSLNQKHTQGEGGTYKTTEETKLKIKLSLYKFHTISESKTFFPLLDTWSFHTARLHTEQRMNERKWKVEKKNVFVDCYHLPSSSHSTPFLKYEVWQEDFIVLMVSSLKVNLTFFAIGSHNIELSSFCRNLVRLWIYWFN